MKLIYLLKEIHQADRPRVGGKAYALARMAAIFGAPVSSLNNAGNALKAAFLSVVTLGIYPTLAGEIDYALLPIENTIAGSLQDVYRLLDHSELWIVDEEILPIEHTLLARPGTRLEDLQVIRSHPVALQQCDRFLAALENLGGDRFRHVQNAVRYYLKNRST